MASDPAGAQVFLDGELLGETPLQLGSVRGGDHRVRLVKKGYLENSRMVKVRAGAAEAVAVKLTRHEAEALPLMQVEDPPQGGGGSKKALLIGAAVVAAGVGAFLVLRNTNKAPVAGTIGVSPTGTGMAGTTTFTFTAAGASDPDNDSLTFNWTFGDGSSGSGQSVTKVYSNTGTFSVGLTVSDGKAQATAPAATVTVARNMAGVFSGAREPGFDMATVSVNLTQSGTSLGGSITFVGFPNGTLPNVTGTVSTLSYPCTVNFASPVYTIGGSGSYQTRFSGTMDASGNTMTGTITTTEPSSNPPSVSRPATFRRQ